jgi:hypothetical protein
VIVIMVRPPARIAPIKLLKPLACQRLPGSGSPETGNG